MKTILTAVALTVAATSAMAADISTRIIDGINHVTFQGEVVEGDNDRLKAVLEANPKIEWISFDSNGGSLYEGRQIGYTISDYLMSSRVRSGNSCMSACANAFINGDVLSVEGTLGFHSFYYTTYEGQGRIRADLEEIRGSIYNAQESASLDVYNIMRNGFSWDLHYDYTQLQGEFLEFTSNEELQAYYIGRIDISKKFIDGKTKEFKTVVVKNVDSDFTNKSVRFKSAGSKQFFVKLNGKSVKKYVPFTATWKAGSTKGNYTYVFSGRTTTGQTLPAGWVLTKDLQLVY